MSTRRDIFRMAAVVAAASAGPSLSGAAPAAGPQAWRADLKAFSEGMSRRHVAPFNFTPKPKFEASVAALDARLERLNSDQFFVELDRIAAAVGDAHTYVVHPDDTPRFPTQIVQYGGEFRVVGAGAAARTAVGAKLVKIGSTAVEQVFAATRDLLCHNEHASLRDLWATGYLNSGMMLHGQDFIAERTRGRFVFESDDGRAFELELIGVPPGGEAFTSAATATPISRTRPQAASWCEYLANEKAVYCNFRRYNDAARTGNEMQGLVRQEKPEKLIVDLRQQTSGGDYNVGHRSMIAPIKLMPEINRKGRLFVLIGTGTFSAALSNVAQFRAETQATLVGRPLGEKPNSYAENDDFMLPNTGLSVHYATRYYEFAKGDAGNMIRPDKEIVPTWADFMAGRDPVVDWVLAQPAA